MSILNLRVGDLVEIRPAAEILATLDASGAVDGLPFMPEMLRYCGRRARVHKRADKACDTIHYGGSRRMRDAVHLENLRCDGEAHGGCDARCLMYWKEAWLKRVDASEPRLTEVRDATAPRESAPVPELLEAAKWQTESTPEEPRYRCQITDLLKATESMKWWDPRQYLRDLRSGNVRIRDFVYAAGFRSFRTWLWHGVGYRISLRAYNRFQRWRGGTPFPMLRGRLEQTPKETLDLKPGELVQVKSLPEIVATVNSRNRNRGLSFDPEMVPYCGRVFRVASRVSRIIDEPTGKLVSFTSDCIILDGVVCNALYSGKRLFCPRAIPPFWREIWLRRVPSESASVPAMPEGTWVDSDRSAGPTDVAHQVRPSEQGSP